MGTQPRVIVEISGCLNTNPLRAGPTRGSAKVR